jgi:uncharacterized protein YkwD
MIALILTAVLCHTPLSPVESAMVQAVNQERALHGLHPLRVDQRLMNSARQHAIWMAAMRVNMHSRTPNVAENIAASQRTVAEVTAAWMASPGHRANILNPAWRRVGVTGVTSGNGWPYWVQQFGILR